MLNIPTPDLQNQLLLENVLLKFRRVIVQVTVIALCIATISLPPAKAQGTLRSTHSDWEIRCDTPAGRTVEQCVMLQSIRLAQAPDYIVRVIAFKANNGVFRMLLPLGLTLGLRGGDVALSVDEKNLPSVNIIRCLPNGCVTENELTDTYLGAFKAGKQLRVIYRDGQLNEVPIFVSLAGFTAAYNALP